MLWGRLTQIVEIRERTYSWVLKNVHGSLVNMSIEVHEPSFGFCRVRLVNTRPP